MTTIARLTRNGATHFITGTTTACGRTWSALFEDASGVVTCKACRKATTPLEHGTYAMYQRELRADGAACGECRATNSAYIAEYRATNPDKYRQELERRYARERALAILARRHPEELDRLVRAELTVAAGPLTRWRRQSRPTHSPALAPPRRRHRPPLPTSHKRIARPGLIGSGDSEPTRSSIP